MKLRTSRVFLVTSLLALLAAACSVDPSEPSGAEEAVSAGASALTFPVLPPISPPGVLVPTTPAPAAPQSFAAPSTWAREMTVGQGWTGEFPRMLADLDGNGRKDVVGFGLDGVWVARSLSTSFDVRYVLADFGRSSGWTSARHERLVGDITGDGRDDIVGFGNGGVYVATTTATGFNPVSFVVADFGYDQGWRVDQHDRLLADVNGDGKKDVVAYGNDGVWIALANGSGFSAPAYVLARFGNNAGFSPARHVRTAGDVNGDGREDLVVFGEDGVYTALSTGSGFATPNKVVSELGYDRGWRVDKHPRLVVDVNQDGRKDLVGFGIDGVWIAQSNGAGFSAATYVLAAFGANQGFTTEGRRFVTDLNGDGYIDIVGIGSSSVWRSLGGPSGFDAPAIALNLFTPVDHYGSSAQPVMAGDVDGDGKVDLVGFGSTTIDVARSTAEPLPPAPNTPTNLTASASAYAVTLGWTDTSSDEIRFSFKFWRSGDAKLERFLPANTTTTGYSGLTPSTRYCFSVQSQSAFAVSAIAEKCFDTPAAGGGGGGGGSDPASMIECGTGNPCEAGYHPEGYLYESSCKGTSTNATNCVTNNTTVFTSCGIQSCPNGFHPSKFIFTLACNLGSTIDDNSTTCQRDAGTTFTSCGFCPAGYHATATTPTSRADNCWPYANYTCAKD